MSKRLPDFLVATVAPTELCQAILLQIEKLERRSARVRFFLFASATSVSGLVLIPAVQYAAQEFYTSGFYSYWSLLFSDGRGVMAYWQDIAYSLFESLPSLALLLIIAAAAAMAWSLRGASRVARTAFV